mmetsp:Transcript_63241/g.56990  ORF Transcript_63241/g.56990 Transcript_63241/m.56990 type:complete len:161 (+) Transcript_63241:24-506(+)
MVVFSQTNKINMRYMVAASGCAAFPAIYKSYYDRNYLALGIIAGNTISSMFFHGLASNALLNGKMSNGLFMNGLYWEKGAAFLCFSRLSQICTSIRAAKKLVTNGTIQWKKFMRWVCIGLGIALCVECIGDEECPCEYLYALKHSLWHYVVYEFEFLVWS